MKKNIIFSKKLSKIKGVICGTSTKFYGDQLRRKNRIDFLKDLKIYHKDLLLLEQIHFSKIKNISKKDLKNSFLKGLDGAFSREKNIFIGIKSADCIPLLFIARDKSIFGALHLSWKTLAFEIIEFLFNFKEIKNKNPKNFIFYLGPGVKVCHYEFSKADLDKLSKIKEFKKAKIFKDKKIFLDLFKLAELKLLKFGVPKENIEISPYCTACNTDLFFSKRGERDIKGENLSVIGIFK